MGWWVGWWGGGGGGRGQRRQFNTNLRANAACSSSGDRLLRMRCTASKLGMELPNMLSPDDSSSITLLSLLSAPTSDSRMDCAPGPKRLDPGVNRTKELGLRVGSLNTAGAAAAVPLASAAAAAAAGVPFVMAASAAATASSTTAGGAAGPDACATTAAAPEGLDQILGGGGGGVHGVRAAREICSLVYVVRNRGRGGAASAVECTPTPVLTGKQKQIPYLAGDKAGAVGGVRAAHGLDIQLS